MPARTVKKAPSFEEELQKLETMADQMEQSQLPLEELMKLYEQGVALTRRTEKKTGRDAGHAEGNSRGRG